MTEICAICQLKVKDGSFLKHMNGIHGPEGTTPKTDDEINEAENKAVPRWFDCPHCGQHYNGRKGRDFHIRMKHRANHEEENENDDENEAGQQQHGNNAANNNNVQLIDNNSDFGYLIAHFKKGWFSPHRTHMEHIRTIMITLINQGCSEDEDEWISIRGIVALQLFPGVMQRITDHGEKGVTPIGMLRSIQAANNWADYIILAAIHLEDIKKARKPFSEIVPNAERARSKVERLVRDGRITAARREVSELDRIISGREKPRTITQAEIDAKIVKLFPKADLRDLLPHPDNDPPLSECHQISANDIRRRFYTMKTDAGAGTSGYTPRMLKWVGDDRKEKDYCADTQPSAFHEALAKFANRMLRGEFNLYIRDILCEVRLAMIDTKTEEKGRGIGVECALMRLLMSSTTQEPDRIIGGIVGRLQLGAGVPNGPEIVGRLCDQLYNSGFTIKQLDSSNAYGSMRLGPLYDAVLEMLPQLIPFFRWRFQASVMVRDSNGLLITERETGLGQGDVWAVRWYAIGSYAMLQQLERDLRASEAEQNLYQSEPVPPGLVVALFDDVYTACQSDAAIINASKVEPTYAEHGAKLNISKSGMTGINAEATSDVPEGFKINNEGSKAVGIYFGQERWKKDRIMEKIIDMAPPTEALALLQPRTRSILLSKSYSKQAIYTINTAESFELIKDAAALFDDTIVKEVLKVAQLEFTTRNRTVIQQPRREGGMGFQMVGGMEAEAGIIKGHLAKQAFLGKYYPDMY